MTTSPSTEPSTRGTRPTTEGGFGELAALVSGAGLLQEARRTYLLLFAANAVLLAGGLTVFVWLGPSWWQLLLAVFFAVVTTQLAFIGHDAGHRQIFTGRRANDVVGYLHGGLVGLSYGSWVTQHTAHHAHPNHADDDPDIDIPVLAFSPEQAAATRGPVRWMVGHQAYLFLPLLLLEGWSLHITAVRAVVRREVPRPRLEATLLLAHAVGYLGAVFWVLDPLQAVVFVVVHQGLWGVYMGLAFAPNHKGMPVIPAGRRLDHLHKQVLTSRNVLGGRVLDLAMGGLNYQVEHHLFPRMPRPYLRRAQPIVQAFCTAHDLPYTRTGPLRSYAEVLRHLHAVGAPLRRPTGPPAP